MNGIVFDIGGTHTRLGRVENGTLGAIERLDTSAPDQTLRSLQSFIENNGGIPGAVAGGIAGRVDSDGTLTGGPNLPEWHGFNLAKALKDLGIAAVHVRNDAEVEGLGEAHFGAGKGFSIVGYLTVGTGVGGTLVVNGVTAPSVHGIEPGKQIIDYAHERTLETLTGGAALLAEFGAPPEQLPREVLDERTVVLAVGLYNLARIWSPEVLIVNGAVINDVTGYRLADLERELLRIADGRPMPKLIRATLGDTAGLWGAAVLLG